MHFCASFLVTGQLYPSYSPKNDDEHSRFVRFTAEGRAVSCHYTGLFLTTEGNLEPCAFPAWLLTLLKTVCLDRLGGKRSSAVEIFIAVYQPVKPQYCENGNSQLPVLSVKNVPTCAGVRLSFPYYRVRIMTYTHYYLGIYADRTKQGNKRHVCCCENCR